MSKRSWFAAATLAVAFGCGQHRRPEGVSRVSAVDASPVDAGQTDATPIRIDASDPVSRSFEAADLPPWPGDDPTASAVVVHAVDASGEHLRALLADADSYLVTAAGTQVTGRARSASRSAAGLALAAAYPDGGLQPPTRHTIRGRGVKVDLDFAAVDAANVLRLLADVLGVNIVTAGDELPRVSVAVRGAPAGGVLDALFDLLGMSRHRRGHTIFASLGGDATPDKRFRKLRKPRLDFDVAGARASDAIALLGAATRVGFAAPCEQGRPVTVRLRNAPLGDVLAALQLASGLTLAKAPSGATCEVALPASLKEGFLGRARLVGIALLGSKAAAVFQMPDGPPLVVRRGDELPDCKITHIGAGFVRIEQRAAGKVDLDLSVVERAREETPEERYAPWRRMADPTSARLAATLIEGERAHALLEQPRGTWHVLQATAPAADENDPYAVRITATHVTLEAYGEIRAELELRPRPDR